MAELADCRSPLCPTGYANLLGPGSESEQKLWHFRCVAPEDKIKGPHSGQDLFQLCWLFLALPWWAQELRPVLCKIMTEKSDFKGELGDYHPLFYEGKTCLERRVICLKSHSWPGVVSQAIPLRSFHWSGYSPFWATCMDPKECITNGVIPWKVVMRGICVWSEHSLLMLATSC